MIFVDSHVHLYKFSDSELKIILKDKKTIFISVAENFETSLKNLSLSFLHENIIPAVGVHPWKVENISKENLKNFEDLVNKNNIKILGEIGLDKKFYPNTIEKQKEIFEFFLKLAKEYDLSVNLNSVGAWKETLDYILKYDIKRAYFHWYTGPIEILNDIVSHGFFIGINVACLIQNKHKEILDNVNLNNILTESDGPYEYKSFILHPKKLPELYEFISKMKKIDIEFLSNKIKYNLSKFIY